MSTDDLTCRPDLHTGKARGWLRGAGGGRGPRGGRDDPGGCLLAVGASRAQGSNKFSSVQFRHNTNAADYESWPRQSVLSHSVPRRGDRQVLARCQYAASCRYDARAQATRWHLPLMLCRFRFTTGLPCSSASCLASFRAANAHSRRIWMPTKKLQRRSLISKEGKAPQAEGSIPS